jgi:hypothetical protein
MSRRLLRATGIGAVVCVLCGTPSVAADDIALSLVHRTERIDIPANAISRIDVTPSFVFTDLRTRKRVQSRAHSVNVCLHKDIRDRICELTWRIVGEPLEIVAGCGVLTRPVVREPICRLPCLSIPAEDAAEARAFVDKLRQRPKENCAPRNIGMREQSVRIAFHKMRGFTESAAAAASRRAAACRPR